MRLTLVHPCIGRRRGERYIRSWQMEPLAPATLAGLTPRDRDTDIRFYDDRMEPIPFDEPTDLVAISVETYTAKRSYQIASEFRRRGVPVVMGGFHPTLVPDEASEYAESIVIGEAESVWPRLIDDFRHGRLQREYRQIGRPPLADLRVDRSIFSGKRYLPVGLVEAGRGCHFRCEFCAIQSFFGNTQTRRPTEATLDEIRSIRKPLIFFVDDNITSNMEQAKEFFRALIPLKIRWVSQASINAAHDEEFLRLIKASGCQGLLIGFESLNPDSLRRMRKSFNLMHGGYERALENLRRHQIRLYVTFILGYDDDQGDTLDETLAFAERHRFYIVAFNHLTPFPGTPLYERLQREGRLLYDRWWLDPDYRYGMVPFAPHGMTADEVRERCLDGRRRFYRPASILKRGLDMQVNGSSWFMWTHFFSINLLFRAEVSQRRDFPLGDEAYTTPLVRTAHTHAGPSTRARRSLMEVAVDFAGPADDAGIRELVARQIMPGRVQLTLTREPDFSLGCAATGEPSHVVVARSLADGAIVGVACRTSRRVFLNGREERVAYLSQLRIDKRFRGRWLVSRGFARLEELHRQDPVAAYFTSIVDGNDQATNLLVERRRPSFPHFRAVAHYQTCAIPLWRSRPSFAGREAIAPATSSDVPELVAFLRREAARRHLATAWTERTLHGMAKLGLSIEDIWIARRGRNEIAGVAALWDQTAYKQSIVRGYSGWLRLLSALPRGGRSWLPRPVLPGIGEQIRSACASLVTVADDDPAVCARLLRELYRLARARMFDYLLIGLDERDPLLGTVRRYPHVSYPSRLYLGAWASDSRGRFPYEQLDSRPAYVDVATL